VGNQTNQFTNEPTDGPTNQQTNQPTNKPTNQSTNQATNHSMEQKLRVIRCLRKTSVMWDPQARFHITAVGHWSLS
jgi:hypothetical protein